MVGRVMVSQHETADSGTVRKVAALACVVDHPTLVVGAATSGPRVGELYWNSLSHDQVLRILHNPAYAGAYAYGRARHTAGLDGRHHTLSKPIDQWTVLIHDHHPGYVTWPRYQASLQGAVSPAYSRNRVRSAPPSSHPQAAASHVQLATEIKPLTLSRTDEKHTSCLIMFLEKYSPYRSIKAKEMISCSQECFPVYP
jgi:Recombinase